MNLLSVCLYYFKKSPQSEITRHDQLMLFFSTLCFVPLHDHLRITDTARYIEKCSP